MLTAHDVTAEALVKLVLHVRGCWMHATSTPEPAVHRRCLLLIPLEHDQPDGIDHTRTCTRTLLRDLRIERLKSPRVFAAASQPVSPLAAGAQCGDDGCRGNHFVTRTEFHYSEARGDEMLMLVGTAFHHFRVDAGALRFTLKRVNLLNCDAALPSIQLFI